MLDLNSRYLSPNLSIAVYNIDITLLPIKDARPPRAFLDGYQPSLSVLPGSNYAIWPVWNIKVYKALASRTKRYNLLYSEVLFTEAYKLGL